MFPLNLSDLLPDAIQKVLLPEDDTQGASNQFDHLLVVVKHLEPLLGIEGVAEHLDVALLQPILGVEELQPILSVTGNQLVDAAVLLANGVEGRAL